MTVAVFAFRWAKDGPKLALIYVASAALARSPSIVSLSFPQPSILSCPAIQKSGLYFSLIRTCPFINLMRTNTGATTLDSRPQAI